MREVPIHGMITDQTGRPIARAEVMTGQANAISHSEGRFTLHSFGPPPHHFQLRMGVERL